MAGIYVHIPFCKSRCIYCGFFSTTSLEWRQGYADAVVAELRRRRDFLRGEPVDTLYFGGGTPSLMPVAELERILEAVYNIYNVREGAEVTLEGNPDDLSRPVLEGLRRMGINRLSMGVQTFSDGRLRFLHRRHTSAQAVRAVRSAQEAGFDNLSIDLMFGFPGQTLAEWQEDVRQALALQVQHLSAYSLMYEEGTVLCRMLDKGLVAEVDEEVSLQMYEYLMDAMVAAGYQHYEISNFALPGMHSRHNSCYWHGVPYLGVGAGAHSYDGQRRCYNVEVLADYLEGKSPVWEVLTRDEHYDEYVFTGLRTSEGIDLRHLAAQFGEEYRQTCLVHAAPHLRAGRLRLEGHRLRLTRQGLFVSNDVMSDFMCAEG